MTRALSLLPYALAARIGRWLRGRKVARLSAGRQVRAMQIAQATNSTGR